jgi:hypothetical protein
VHDRHGATAVIAGAIVMDSRRPRICGVTDPGLEAKRRLARGARASEISASIVLHQHASAPIV